MNAAVVAFLVLVVTPLLVEGLEPLPTAADGADRPVSGLARAADDVPEAPARYADATATWFELLGEAVPEARRVSILVMLEDARDPDVAAWSAIAEAAGQAARRRALRSEIMTVRHRGDLLDAFVMMRQSGIDGVVVLPTRFALARAADVAALATRHRLPLIGGHRRFVDSGALMSYGPAAPERARPAITGPNGVVDAARPADTLTEPPARFELVINDRTARTLGLTIHPSLRRRAAHIID